MVTARAPGEALAGVPAPPRTLLAKVNSHLICVLCRGYYVDATTIVECLHTFCRSCIVKHLRLKSYCPVCEVMINSARPNIKLDKALQDIVYKLVPGLFQREMARRRAFYRTRPRAADHLTPEQRGQDTERVVFSPDDVISFSLEYAASRPKPSPPPPPPSASDESSEGPDDEAAESRRFLRCPAIVNISHLKKFLSLKFDIDAAHFFVDILYKRVPLPDYYTLMDVAYIYNWKRIEPMRFFYQITDFTAARDRFGFVVMTGNDRGPTEGDAPGSPARPRGDSAEGNSTGSRTPPSDDASACAKSGDGFSETEERDRREDESVGGAGRSRPESSPPDAEKSQFLNSFELTPKCSPTKNSTSPADRSKPNGERDAEPASAPTVRPVPVKRKAIPGGEASPEPKRQKSVPEKSKADPEIKIKPKTIPTNPSVLENLLTQNSSTDGSPSERKPETSNGSPVERGAEPPKRISAPPLNLPEKPKKAGPLPTENRPKPTVDPPQKKCKNPIIKTFPGKRKLSDAEANDPPKLFQRPKTVEADVRKEPRAPLVVESETRSPSVIPGEVKNPPLKMSICMPKQGNPNPTLKMDVKKHPEKSTKPKKGEGENPLRTLFNSCNINIPSSLSITLTDQKLEQKPGETPEENVSAEAKKRIQPPADPLASERTPPSPTKPSAPADKNSLEIIKLSEAENAKVDSQNANQKNPPVSAGDGRKPSETVTGKGRDVPNLKPISEAKIAPFSKPQTFQQTFLASLQQQNEKPKYAKSRAVHPKMATSGIKSEDISDPNKPPVPPKPQTGPQLPPIQKLSAFTKSVKSDSALDLSTPHPIPSQFGPSQAKALETMQSIDILAKRQQHSQRMMSPQNFSPELFKMRATGSGGLRIPAPPSNNPQSKMNMMREGAARSPKQFPEYFKQTTVRAPNDPSLMPAMKPISQQSTSTSTSTSSPQSLERIQTRSPSSSPKLVIACPSPKSQSPEQKPFVSPRSQETTGQSNLISSSQITSSIAIPSEASHSKDIPKMMKSPKLNPSPKPNIVRPPNPNSNNLHKLNMGPGDGSTGSEMFQGLLAQQNYIRQQLELQTRLGLLPPGAARQWFNNPIARAQIDNFVKNMTQSPPQYKDK